MSFHASIKLLFTFIDDGYAVAIVNQRWQGAQAVLFGQVFIRNFDERNAQLVSFVVNVFQLAQNLFALLTLGPI